VFSPRYRATIHTTCKLRIQESRIALFKNRVQIEYRGGKKLLINIPSSGLLRRVALARTNVSEEGISSIIRVKRISELGITLTVQQR
jgi:hypothetical protein